MPMVLTWLEQTALFMDLSEYSTKANVCLADMNFSSCMLNMQQFKLELHHCKIISSQPIGLTIEVNQSIVINYIEFITASSSC
jgi:hypothetical protein